MNICSSRGLSFFQRSKQPDTASEDILSSSTVSRLAVVCGNRVLVCATFVSVNLHWWFRVLVFTV
jgi:hypothetical protein